VEEARKPAFVFPGQGSQHVGMAKDLCAAFPVAREVFRKADEVLRFPLSRLCFEGPEEELKLTENAQPAILAASIAALRVLEAEVRLKPACVAGHSLGEYSALVAAGALEFADALAVVRERGRLMQRAVPPGAGAMIAVLGLSAEEVESICGAVANGEVLGIAGFNGGGQLVVAGSRGAVERAKEMARSRGARSVVELPVSAPFHCGLMEPAAAGLKEVLAAVAVRPFSAPVITNVEAAPNVDPERVKPLLVEQVVRPVRWEESVRCIERLGCAEVIEVGPGNVLRGLIRRIAPNLRVSSFESPADLERLR
jgi:[acyl-carrier-protein] S-malonyltransferase